MGTLSESLANLALGTVAPMSLLAFFTPLRCGDRPLYIHCWFCEASRVLIVLVFGAKSHEGIPRKVFSLFELAVC